MAQLIDTANELWACCLPRVRAVQGWVCPTCLSWLGTRGWAHSENISTFLTGLISVTTLENPLFHFWADPGVPGGTSAAAPVPGGCLPQPAAGTAALEPLLMPWRAKPKHNAFQALRSLSWISPSFSRLATNTTHLAFSHPKNEKRGKFPERKQQGSKDITQRMYQLCDFYVTTILGGFSSFLYRSNIFLCCCSYDWAALWNGSAGDPKKKNNKAFNQVQKHWSHSDSCN